MTVFTFNETIEVSKCPTKPYKQSKMQWFKKHSRRLAAIFSIVMFSLLIGVVIFDHDTRTSNAPNRRTFKGIRNYCTDRKLYIECNQVPEGKSLAASINAIQSEGNINLHIKNTKFPDDILTASIFVGIEPSVLVLEIEKCPITDIQENALSTAPFKLTELTIVECKIFYLRKHSLSNLHLETFQFRFNSHAHGVKVEANVLEPISDTLKVLQFQNCLESPVTIFNLTGSAGSVLKALHMIDFRYNTGLKEIAAKSFIKSTDVLSLFLSDGSISKIDVDAFKGMTNVKVLNLDNNKLETLPEGVFKEIRTNKGNLSLSKNSWRCDCDLSWLQQFYLETDYISKENPLQCDDGESFDEVEFCSSSTSQDITSTPTETETQTEMQTETQTETQTTTQTETNTEKQTAEPEEVFYEIRCRDLGKLPVDIPQEYTTEYLYSVITEVRNQTLTFLFYEPDLDPFVLQVEIQGNATDYHLMWVDTKDKSSSGCVTNLQSTTFLEDLKRGSTYTICLLHKNVKGIKIDTSEMLYSPNDCMGITIPVEWEKRAWIQNKSMVPAIASLAVALLLAAVISSVIAFCCIRKHPKLIKGNKRVIIIEKKIEGDVAMIPKEYDNPAYVAPSIASYNQGYLTPKYHKYTRVKYRPPLARSLSEQSVLNDYVRPEVPNNLELEEWRMDVRKRPALYKEVSDYDEIPPPVPEGHPHSFYNNKVSIISNKNPYSVA